MPRYRVQIVYYDKYLLNDSNRDLFIQLLLWKHSCLILNANFDQNATRYFAYVFSSCLSFSPKRRSCNSWRSGWRLRRPSWRRSEPWEDKSTTVNWSTETSVSLNTLSMLQRGWLCIAATAVYDYTLVNHNIVLLIQLEGCLYKNVAEFHSDYWAGLGAKYQTPNSLRNGHSLHPGAIPLNWQLHWPQPWLHRQSWCGNTVGSACSGLWELTNQCRLGFSGGGALKGRHRVNRGTAAIGSMEKLIV